MNKWSSLIILLKFILIRNSVKIGLKSNYTLIYFRWKNVHGKKCPNLNLVLAAEREREYR